MSIIEGNNSPNPRIHQAALDGDVNVVKDLISKGADKDEKNNEGDTPLIVAVCANHLNVVQCLVQHGYS